jgi:hypothetical protein
MKFEGARARNFVEQKKIFVPNLLFFGSQEAVKKFGPKIVFSLNWSSHPSGIPTVNLVRVVILVIPKFRKSPTRILVRSGLILTN